jgi:hypothetical protein
MVRPFFPHPRYFHTLCATRRHFRIVGPCLSLRSYGKKRHPFLRRIRVFHAVSPGVRILNLSCFVNMKSPPFFTVTLAISFLFNFLAITKAVPCVTKDGSDGVCYDVADCAQEGGDGNDDASGNCNSVSTSFIIEANITRIRHVVQNSQTYQPPVKELVHLWVDNPVEDSSTTQRYLAHVVISHGTVVSRLLFYTVINLDSALPLTDVNTGLAA